MNFGIKDAYEISLIDTKTGEKVMNFSSDIKELSISKEHTPHKYYSFLNNKEITLEIKNAIWFPEELSKIHYMKIHAKTKRLKKKHTKLFYQKQTALFEKILGISAYCKII
jgi:hypothetical protein